MGSLKRVNIPTWLLRSTRLSILFVGLSVEIFKGFLNLFVSPNFVFISSGPRSSNRRVLARLTINTQNSKIRDECVGAGDLAQYCTMARSRYLNRQGL